MKQSPGHVNLKSKNPYLIVPEGFGAIATNRRPSHKHKGGTFVRTAGECFPQGFTGRVLRISALTPERFSITRIETIRKTLAERVALEPS